MTAQLASAQMGSKWISSKFVVYIVVLMENFICFIWFLDHVFRFNWSLRKPIISTWNCKAHFIKQHDQLKSVRYKKEKKTVRLQYAIQSVIYMINVCKSKFLINHQSTYYDEHDCHYNDVHLNKYRSIQFVSMVELLLVPPIEKHIKC